MALIFITPVFWFVDEMPEEISKIFLLNPVATLIYMSHQSLLFSIFPSLGEIVYSTVISVGLLIFAYLLFKKKEKQMVEML